jgi:hypothetical protein
LKFDSLERFLPLRIDSILSFFGLEVVLHIFV